MSTFLKNQFSDPPRSVPVSVRLRILFGGFSNQFGWLFFGFGMIFVWVFGGSSALHSWVFFSSELALTEGTISAVAETNITINNQPLYEYRYSYSVNNISYTGSTRDFGGKYRKGEKAPIEYSVRDHARSRVKGMSESKWTMLLTLIFPVVGLAFIVSGMRKAVKGNRLLSNGKQAVGVLISQEPTNTRINDQPVYKFTFEFTADDGEYYRAVAKTHVLERFAGENIKVSEDLIDEHNYETVKEPLLYNPIDPGDAIMLDDLPGGPRINDRGEIQSNVPALIPSIIIPGVGIIGHTYWFLHVLEIL
jgi:hypothetical protein